MATSSSCLLFAAPAASVAARNWPIAGVVANADARNTFAKALIAQLPALRRYSTALTGSISTADDLVQDCAERALRQSAQLKEPKRLAAWLRSIVYNLYIDELRRRRIRGNEQDVDELSNTLALSLPSSDRSDTSGFVRAMQSLSAEHRQILLLVGVDGLNYREIAEELKVPIGTVMSRLARARTKLRSALEGGVPDSSRDDPISFQKANR